MGIASKVRPIFWGLLMKLCIQEHKHLCVLSTLQDCRMRFRIEPKLLPKKYLKEMINKKVARRRQGDLGYRSREPKYFPLFQVSTREIIFKRVFCREGLHLFCIFYYEFNVYRLWQSE
ncbi:hypothetical protein DCO16_03070 [Polynucleobacter antarcticus]|uniref:Uncharacterized protein n=1 Tax=Polynucleobacter antarcticus TaxID=1743162 RepID=A0A6M9PTD4_9BURK|nr:hypothetical protein DCO16_03070 [Polynucleobacter antarcticus]